MTTYTTTPKGQGRMTDDTSPEDAPEVIEDRDDEPCRGFCYLCGAPTNQTEAGGHFVCGADA